MEIEPLLDGLDDIAWNSLVHAYGAAGDVPELLRALLADDDEKRRNAQEELFGNIWHQGTVYEATAYAVPFLRELLARPDLRDRDAVLRLFASIADGRGYLEVHARDPQDEAAWRHVFAERGTTLEAELARENQTVAAVRTEVAKGLRFLLECLQSTDSELRCTVASALEFHPAHSHEIIPASRAALEQESDHDARIALQKSLEALARRGPA